MTLGNLGTTVGTTLGTALGAKVTALFGPTGQQEETHHTRRWGHHRVVARRDLLARADHAEERLRHDEEVLHELRAAIAGISIASQLLQAGEDEVPPATRSRLRHTAAAELERLQRLLTSDERAPLTPFSLRPVLTPIIDAASAWGLPVTWDAADDLVLGRPDDVAEIVQNLLHNAWRHAPGASVSVSARRTPRGVAILVSDDGQGVDVSVRPTLFQRGARGAESPGSGLGLHIAHRLAIEMNGQLRLELPHRGGGACFVLTLPTPLPVQVVPSCLAPSV